MTSIPEHDPEVQEEYPYVEPGRVNRLKVIEFMPQGAYLEGDEYDPRILLPTSEIPQGVKPGDVLEVFLYFDSEDRIIATCKTPKVQLGELGFLKCVHTTRFGAFLDWGLSKDLLVPNKEQQETMKEGQQYLVMVRQDEKSDLLYATSKEKWFFDHDHEYVPGDRVQVTPVRYTDLGTVCLVDQDAFGLLFYDQYPGRPAIGKAMDGMIDDVRPDGKISLNVRSRSNSKRKNLHKAIVEAIRDDGGALSLTDRSSPEEIHARFGVSKKRYKQALAELYSAGTVALGETVTLQ